MKIAGNLGEIPVRQIHSDGCFLWGGEPYARITLPSSHGSSFQWTVPVGSVFGVNLKDHELRVFGGTELVKVITVEGSWKYEVV